MGFIRYSIDEVLWRYLGLNLNVGGPGSISIWCAGLKSSLGIAALMWGFENVPGNLGYSNIFELRVKRLKRKRVPALWHYLPFRLGMGACF